MTAVRIGPDIPVAIVDSPDYFRAHAVPNLPTQLIDHRAINLRLPQSAAGFVCLHPLGGDVRFRA